MKYAYIVFSTFLGSLPFQQSADAFLLGNKCKIRRTSGARRKFEIESLVPTNKDGGESNDNESSISKGNDDIDNEKFRMVFTCNRCETRNMIEITRKAWATGIVIATCQGCNVKHLLADNMSRLNNNGVNGDDKFRNVLSQLQSSESATFIKNYDSMDDAAKRDALSEFDLTTDENGNIQLMPRPGDEFVVNKDRVSATGPTVDPSLIEEDKSIESKTAEIAGEDGSESNTSARMDSYDSGGSFEIELPAGSEAGDLLQLSLGNSIMMLSVPEGIPSGAKVRVMGAIEFMVPEGRNEGDIITLKLPEGGEIVIQVPQGVTEGSFLKVAHPVILAE